MVFAGELIQRADLQDYLQSKFERLIENQAKEIGVGYFKSLVRNKQSVAQDAIVGEFKEVFNNVTFAGVMQKRWNRFEADVCLPVCEAFTGLWSDRFYALPGYLLAARFKAEVSRQLSSAEGLEDIYRDVFDRKLGEEKRAALIEFSGDAGAGIAVSRLYREAVPRVTGLIRNSLQVKRIGKDVYVWGVNEEKQWMGGAVKGHLYFDRRDERPGPEILTSIEALRPSVEARLADSRTSDLVERLAGILDGKDLSIDLRDRLSVSI